MLRLCLVPRRRGQRWGGRICGVRGRAEVEEGGFVGGGAVADVFFEAVAGVLFGEVYHVAVAGDFCDDGGGADFFDEKVGFREEGDFVRERSVGEEVDGAVDEDFVETDFLRENLFDGAAGSEL